MGAPSKLGKSERQAAVLSLLRREEPAQILARRYGVSDKTLYSWRDVFLEGGQAALGNGRSKGDPRDRTIRELQEQLDDRDKVIGELTIANRVLKKRQVHS
jgi:transposase-like protein